MSKRTGARLQRILIAVDFSSESDIAVLHAVELARQDGARVILVHVSALPTDLLADSSYDPIFRAQGSGAEFATDHRRQAADMLQATETRCQALGVEAESVLVDDNPSDGLARIADELRADLLVLGTHGRTGLKRFLLGSVAERTVRLARVNTLVARGAIEEGAAYRRILVATDFSPSADAALATAMALASPEARIEVVHCWETPSMPSGLPATPLRAELELAVLQRGERMLAQHQGAKLRFVPVESTPAEGIRYRAEETAADLIVTGSHGRRGARRLLLGSVTESIVRHAPCSVLVVRGPEAAKS
ncbi:MAG TPA: universal stress protein [Kofleriaceae bacterium]|nr:universal stress protein [Kofleriaceae bacterium]